MLGWFGVGFYMSEPLMTLIGMMGCDFGVLVSCELRQAIGLILLAYSLGAERWQVLK